MTWNFLMLLVLSATAFMLAAHFPLSWLDRWPKLWLRLACLFSLLPMLPYVGSEIDGVHGWLALPGGIHMPGHYLVLTFFILAAAALSAEPPKTKTHKAEVIALIGIILIALSNQPSLWGICAMLGLMASALAINGRWKEALTVCVLPLVMLIVSLLSAPYRLTRLLSFLHPEDDPLGRGYQLIANFSVIAKAQWFGSSLNVATHANQEYKYGGLTMLAGHLGLVAASLFILLMASIVILGICRARCLSDVRLRALGLLVSIGLGCWTLFAAAWPLGLSPISNLAMPFVSGGFALVFASLALGVIYRVATDVSVSPVSPRFSVITASVIIIFVGLLVITMWTIKPPNTDIKHSVTESFSPSNDSY